MSAQYTLQLNQSGAWRDFVSYPREEAARFMQAVRPLADLLGIRAKWRVVFKASGYAHVMLDDTAVRQAFASWPEGKA